MNTRKVLLILTLALLSAFNAAAYDKTITIKGIEYSYNDSTATVKSQYNPGDIKYKKSITIPETIKGWDKKKRIVTGIGWQAFKGYRTESIKLPNTIRNIDASAFENCWRLKSINLPEGLQSIGWSAFKGCDNLKSIRLPEGLQSIEHSAFEGCDNLKSINLPEGLQNIEYRAFHYCHDLEYINIENIKEFGDNAFDGCDAFWDYSIPEGAKVGYDAFKDCGKKLRDMIAEQERQKQIQEQQAKQQIIEQQAEIERQNRLNAWIQMAETLGQVANSLNQAINHNSSHYSAVTTTPTARTSASTPHTSTQSKSSNTTKKHKVSPHMNSLAHTYQNWISRLIKMNAQYKEKYNDSERIRYQKEARSVRQLAEQYDNCSVFKSSWEDWDGHRIL